MERRVPLEPIVPGSTKHRLLGDLWQDVRHGLRAMLKQRGFTAVAVLALALGIGGNFNLPDFIDFRDQNQSLAGIAAFANWNVTLTDSGDPQRLQGLRISANAFQMLGVEAVAGRTLLPAEDTPGQQHVVVVGVLWQRRFGADPRLVGETLTLNGASYTVVGILPPRFFFPIREAEPAVPLAPDADPWREVRTSVNFLRALARLKRGSVIGRRREFPRLPDPVGGNNR